MVSYITFEARSVIFFEENGREKSSFGFCVFYDFALEKFD